MDKRGDPLDMIGYPLETLDLIFTFIRNVNVGLTGPTLEGHANF